MEYQEELLGKLVLYSGMEAKKQPSRVATLLSLQTSLRIVESPIPTTSSTSMSLPSMSLPSSGGGGEDENKGKHREDDMSSEFIYKLANAKRVAR